MTTAILCILFFILGGVIGSYYSYYGARHGLNQVMIHSIKSSLWWRIKALDECGNSRRKNALIDEYNSLDLDDLDVAEINKELKRVEPYG